MEVHYHTSPMTSLPVAQASRLDKQALTLSNQGNHTGAEQLHRQALQMKLDAVGESNTTTAVTRNALGELYLKMGRLDEAEEQLRRAVVVRTTSGNVFDAAVSVENLARMYEAKGDLTAALDTRLSYDPNNMVCGNYKVSQINDILLALFIESSPCSAQARLSNRETFEDVQLVEYVIVFLCGHSHSTGRRRYFTAARLAKYVASVLYLLIIDLSFHSKRTGNLATSDSVQLVDQLHLEHMMSVNLVSCNDSKNICSIVAMYLSYAYQYLNVKTLLFEIPSCVHTLGFPPP